MESKITIWRILLFFLIFLTIIYIFSSSPTKKYDDEDEASFSKFKKYTHMEINSTVEKSLDSFVDDLIGFKGLYNYSKDFLGIGSDNKKKIIAGVWDKNLKEPISRIIDDRVQILIEDLYNTNNKCINDFKLKGVNIESFSRELRDSLHKNIEGYLFSFCSSAIDENAINSGIVLGAEASAGLIISKLMKATWITNILSISVDVFISEVINNKFRNELKSKIYKDIKEALYLTLDGPNGLFKGIEKHIAAFHAFRRHAVSVVTQ